MKHLLGLFAVALIALAAPTSADAGGYIGLGIGTNAKLHGDLAAHFDSSDTSSARLTIGSRTGPLALEGSIYGTELRSVTARVAGSDTSMVSAEIGLKYYFNLQGRLEAYLGGGLNKSWINDENQAVMDEGFSGSGYSASVGLQYSLRAVLTQASVWLDYTHSEALLVHSSRADLEGGARTLSIGLSVGF